MRTNDSTHVETEALDDVVRRASRGDDEAFGRLYREYRRRVFGLCRHMLGSPEPAEDATSEVFLKARKAMSSYDSSLPFDRWLFSIASHHCIDQLRRRRVEGRLFRPSVAEAPEPPGPALSPLAQIVSAEERDQVRDSVSRLPEHYRLPVLLRYYSELSYDQIAAALGLSRNNVATLLFRAKKDLRRQLAAARQEVKAQ